MLRPDCLRADRHRDTNADRHAGCPADAAANLDTYPHVYARSPAANGDARADSHPHANTFCRCHLRGVCGGHQP